MQKPLFFSIASILLFTVLLIVLMTRRSYTVCLIQDGYVYIPFTPPQHLLDRTLSQAIENLGTCKGRQMGDIHHESTKRRDVNLTITPHILKLIAKIWTTHQQVWESVVGPDPVFYECSVLMTLPGAKPQLWHRDSTSMGPKYRKVLYIGVLLQDTDAEMGALQVVPSTHTHAKDISSKTERTQKRVLTGKAGDLVCWNANVHHRGGPNVSHRSRFVFYFSVMSKYGKKPSGLTASLRKEYTHKQPSKDNPDRMGRKGKAETVYPSMQKLVQLYG